MNPLTNIKNLNKLNEQELSRGTVGTKTSWHNQYRESAWCFFAGLPFELTEGDIICIFSQYGEIVNINLIREKKTGKSKGFGFICYENQMSTDLAVDNFNGTKIIGRIIRVDHVVNYKPPKDIEDADEMTKFLREQGCSTAKSQNAPVAAKEDPGEERKSSSSLHIKSARSRSRSRSPLPPPSSTRHSNYEKYGTDNSREQQRTSTRQREDEGHHGNAALSYERRDRRDDRQERERRGDERHHHERHHHERHHNERHHNERQQRSERDERRGDASVNDRRDRRSDAQRGDDPGRRDRARSPPPQPPRVKQERVDSPDDDHRRARGDSFASDRHRRRNDDERSESRNRTEAAVAPVRVKQERVERDERDHSRRYK